jgi:hypothetical protein
VRHQLTVLRRQRPGRPRLSSLDRLLWVWLYRICPQIIDAMVLVKPATVVQWHRKGFRFHWRWRSRRPGRPKIGTEIRALIRRMSRANPSWGRPASTGNWSSLASRSAKPRLEDGCRGVGHGTALSAAGPGQIVWPGIPSSRSSDGHHGGHHRPAITLAEPICRAFDRFDPPRMPGSRYHLQRASLTPRPVELFSISS